MGILGGSVEILKNIDSLRTEFIEMRRDFSHLETSFEKFIESSERKIDKMQDENEAMRRRITEMEGVINGTLKVAMHDAIKSLAEEKLTSNGRIDDFNKDSVVKYLDERSKAD